MQKKTISLIGWYGVLAILTGYALVTFNMVGAKSYAFQLLNFSGAVGLIIESASKKDVQPAVLNIVWAVIALIAIVRMLIV